MSWINNLSQILNVVLAIISIIIAVMAIITKLKNKLLSSIIIFIKDAENYPSYTKEQKINLVIEWSKSLFPLRIFKVIFNDKVLEQIAVNLYNDMIDYANKHVESITGVGIKEAKQIIDAVQGDERIKTIVELKSENKQI